MTRYSVEPRTRNYVKGYEFLSFTRKYKKQLLDAGLDASKKVVHKAGEFLGNKIEDVVTKSNDDNIEEQEPVEKIIIPLEKERRHMKQIEKSIIKMEHFKISKLLNDSTVSKFVTKKWVEVNDLSIGQYSFNKSIRFKTSMLRSYLCDYSDAYIVVKGTIDLLATAANENDKVQKNVTFKNNASFRSCITKINSALIDNAEDLHIVLPMYNLLKYSQNYSMALGSFWNYYRDEIDDVDDNASDGKSFNYKTKIVRKTPQRPAQSGNEGDANRALQPPIPALSIEVTIPL